MHEELIRRFIKERLNKDADIVTRLMGGMSNYTYVIEIEGKKYTFRVPGKGAEHFTNRVQEVEIMDSIAKYNFLPQPIINDVATGYKVAPYVEGKILSDIENKPLDAIAATLKKVHSIDKFAYDYEPLKRLESYEKLSNELDPVYLALKDKWLEIYNTKLINVPLCACHGDAQVSNFVLDKERVYLMDWEFSANNDPIYDIACFGNANFNDALELIEVYFDNPGKDEYQRLYAWRMFQCLQWHCVAKYKHEVGLSEELAVDFDYVAKQYLVKAKGFFQDYLNLEEKGE
ncbi:MAG: phosphotransferase family protein [Bacilli bacterium]|jgi:thiamine kinase-like enzyme|nr:phosphotransferase family protein [Bacilli bacterium]